MKLLAGESPSSYYKRSIDKHNLKLVDYREPLLNGTVRTGKRSAKEGLELLRAEQIVRIIGLRRPVRASVYWNVATETDGIA